VRTKQILFAHVTNTARTLKCHYLHILLYITESPYYSIEYEYHDEIRHFATRELTRPILSIYVVQQYSIALILLVDVKTAELVHMDIIYIIIFIHGLIEKHTIVCTSCNGCKSMQLITVSIAHYMNKRSSI
jgi:hypothetical protein